MAGVTSTKVNTALLCAWSSAVPYQRPGGPDAKARAEMIGGNYQTLMNDALKQFAQGLKLSDVVREAIHETWETCLTTHSTGRGKKHRGT